MPRKGVHEFLSPDDEAVLVAWMPPRRHGYSEDPAKFMEEHQREGCRVWKRGVGIVVGGFVVPPAQRLIEEGP